MIQQDKDKSIKTSINIDIPVDSSFQSEYMNVSMLSENKKKNSLTSSSSTSNCDSIKTFCRIRPFNGVNELFIPNTADKRVLHINSQNFQKLNINTTSGKLINSYTFSEVFDETSSQEKVFETTCKDLILDLIQKDKSGLIFTYGMTNAGKTFTVTGSPSSPGILPQSLTFLFKYCQDENIKLSIHCNFVEIYQEDVFDLLSLDPSNAKNKFYKKKINVKENAHGVFYLQDVTNQPILTIDDFHNALNKGIAKKVHSATNLNQNSSRSHTIFKIIINETELNTDPNAKCSSLSIVDLAGSERANKTETSGKELQEACKINQSLSILGKCLEAMKHNSVSTQKKMVPFRESKLTKLFCEYFQGDQNIIMITNINPRKEDFEETVRALNYSCIAKEIKPIKSRIVKTNNYVVRKVVKNNNSNSVGGGNNNILNKSLANNNNNSTVIQDDSAIADNEVSVDDGIESEYVIQGNDNNDDNGNDNKVNGIVVKENDKVTTSSSSTIAELIFQIQKLREEVSNLKTPKYSNELPDSKIKRNATTISKDDYSIDKEQKDLKTKLNEQQHNINDIHSNIKLTKTFKNENDEYNSNSNTNTNNNNTNIFQNNTNYFRNNNDYSHNYSNPYSYMYPYSTPNSNTYCYQSYPNMQNSYSSYQYFQHQQPSQFNPFIQQTNIDYSNPLNILGMLNNTNINGTYPNKNGINFIFLNSKFNDIPGKNHMFSDKTDNSSSDESDSSSDKKNKHKKKANKKKKSNGNKKKRNKRNALSRKQKDKSFNDSLINDSPIKLIPEEEFSLEREESEIDYTREQSHLKEGKSNFDYQKKNSDMESSFSTRGYHREYISKSQNISDTNYRSNLKFL